MPAPRLILSNAKSLENVERLALSPSRAKLYPLSGSFTPIQILSIVRI